MKIVSKVVNSTLYSAVFALKTPAFDHSGISHLAEHMVFRGSDKYPANHELFVINTLLPATINASTQNGISFYFISSKNKRLLMLLIDYVYSGLTQVDYHLNEFLLERDGVLNRELHMYEKQAEYSMFAAALRGDTSAENLNHYGGFSDTMGSNSIEALSLYKQSFYRQENLTLYITGPELIDFEPESLGSGDADKFYTQENSVPLKTEHSTNENSKESTCVITWRIHAAYLPQCLAQRETIQKHLNRAEHIIIEAEINHLGLFALRIISDKPDKIIPIILTVFKDLNITATLYDPVMSSQQSQVIKDCMREYIEQHIYLPPLQGFQAYLSSFQQSRLNPLQAQSFKKNQVQAIKHSSSISNLAKQQLSLDNVPPLPQLFNSVAEQTIGQFRTLENVHWLFELSNLDPLKLTALIIRPEFWSPRLNGECYAMGLGRHKERLFLYGAEDSNATEKERYITEILRNL